jgi:hypothetical protein
MARVTRVLKRFVELDDGSKWSPEGHQYPRAVWPSGHITAWTDKHDQAWHVLEALRQARNLVERLKEQEIAEARQLVEQVRELLSKVEGHEKSHQSHSR